MHKFARHIRPLIAAAVLLLPAASEANISMGQGMGIMDMGLLTHVAGPTPCATNFVFDWTVACNGITAVIR